MKARLWAAALGLFGCTVLQAQYWPPAHSGDLSPTGRGNRPLGVTKPAALTAAPPTGNGITYHNGPVMLGTTHIYYIWYGDWTKDATGPAILNNFANNLGGSPYFNINTTYIDGNNAPVSNSVTLAGSVTDSTTKTALSDADIWAAVVRSFSHGFPVDPNGVYFVLTAPGVTETSGFLTAYCGWHTYNSYNGVTVKYSFVGNAKGPSQSACAAQVAKSPNNDPSADAMASVIAHELEETVTDPQLNAWYDSTGEENADKCAWTFGTTYAASNGSSANMKLGTMDYLIQRNWLNAAGGSCALAYAGSPDFSLSVSPASQSAIQGAKTGSYGITVNAANGFASNVTFAVTGLPPGATLSPPPTASKTASSFALQLSTTTAAGTYPLTITGTSGSLKHPVTATLVVTSSKTFVISMSPALQTVRRGNAGQYTITIAPRGGFNSPVKLSITGVPDRTAAALSASTINGQGSTTVKISPSSTATTGAFTLTVTGTSGTVTATGTATLAVQ